MATSNSATETQPGTSSTLAPLSAADFNSSSFLIDVLGLSPSSITSKGSTSTGSAGVVKTYQCGEFKYPDVSSPLNKILSKSRSNRFGGGSSVHGSGGVESGSGSYASYQQYRESDRSVYSTPDSGLYQPFRSSYEASDNAVDDFQANVRSPQTFSSQPAVGGVAEVTRSRSPQSDGGYGTSFDSNESRGQAMRRDIDIDGLSELLRNISMNTSSMKIPGSPIGTSSAGGPSSNSKTMYGDGLHVPTPSNGGGMTGGLPDFDPAVAHYQQQAAASVQHHHPHANQQQEQAFLQNLQNLHSYMGGGGSGGGRSMGSHLDSSSSGVHHFHPNQFSYRGAYLGGGGGGSMSPSTTALETAARIHRSSAGWERQFSGGPGRAYHAAVNDATCTWSGPLPPRCQNNSPLSCKIFLGGVPWDISDQILVAAFKPFGNIRIEWPNKDNSSTPKGYLYIIFEHEKQVRSLLQACTHDYAHGGSWYYKISSRRMKNKEVQVIPWIISDSSFVRCPSQQLDSQRTVFVGALHGMLSAEGLCNIFNDLFGGVVYASVDTDKYNYPIGSGRVTFNNAKSCMKAVSAAFIEIRTQKFSKKVQVDPYLEDALCSSCGLRQGPYFCRDLNCFKYFCRTCWDIQHTIEVLSHHQPLMRNSRPSSNQNLNKSYGGLPEFFGGNMRSNQTRFELNYE